MQPASAPVLGTALRHPATAATTPQEAFLFGAAWVSYFFRASSLFLSSVFKFLGREQLQTGVENSSSLALPRLSCGPSETVVLKGDIIAWHRWCTRHGLGVEGLTSSLWEFPRSHSAFQDLLDADELGKEPTLRSLDPESNAIQAKWRHRWCVREEDLHSQCLFLGHFILPAATLALV